MECDSHKLQGLHRIVGVLERLQEGDRRLILAPRMLRSWEPLLELPQLRIAQARVLGPELPGLLDQKESS